MDLRDFAVAISNFISPLLSTSEKQFPISSVFHKTSYLTLRKGSDIFTRMVRPSSVRAVSAHQIELCYPDGTQGVIDLSDDIGKGVFAPLAAPSFFATVHLGLHGQIRWNDEIELCPDAAYQEITGHLPAEAIRA
jgi:hypothetical protein